ncbi:hypothetical protein KY290_021688 [Solanum tuberosum]|uniref:Uncharacterized protein n=1 Tax=Solanum tuberosum TaxID=4113 RepID=A0ABQ7V294_SOLTU|nr:hypothetical protein KY284_020708 [Solanum tuberosum]KAH0683099.1 hypothetical protein KY289_020851 [Solanum tuberosum]KAH0758195.1 hypothetical protein KY290_021688 [Solanum tuberosum]
MLLHYNSPASRRLYLQQPRQSEALHYKLYTAGYRLLHYNNPASRRLYITSLTQPDTGFTLQQPRQPEALHYKLYTVGYMLLHYNSPASRGPLHYKTKHYNEEIPLSSKLGQVSAMSSITSYVKDSLSRLNLTRFSEVQI